MTPLPKLYLPRGIMAGGWRAGSAAARLRAGCQALPLLHGDLVFTQVQSIDQADQSVYSVESLWWNWQSKPHDKNQQILTDLAQYSHPEPLKFAGFTLDRPLIMGIVNVTPDSFSDGGEFINPETATDQALRLIDAGADLIDIGGESTRPGSREVDPGEEWQRVAPVIAALARRQIPISVDTRHSLVMERAWREGVTILNDVSGFNYDPKSREIAAKSGLPVIIMHMRGTPDVMNNSPNYENLLREVASELNASVARAEQSGINRENIMIDPGIGFAKNHQHNQILLNGLASLHGLGLPILLGASRKGLIDGRKKSQLLRPDNPISSQPRRIGSSLAAVIQGVQSGVQMFRVHDVRETSEAIAVWRTLSQS
ncbi:MAG: dihydropteroate synthase [Candidatus Symbiobacter sp.]|nr:dihydropteroate synthase [Candidatus Symbiobacter sp.]